MDDSGFLLHKGFKKVTRDNILKEYVDFLLNEKNKDNIISKNISEKAIYCLIEDSLQLGVHIKNKNVVDIGSGNGIVGVPLILSFNTLHMHLVEPRNKKAMFLKKLINHLEIKNLDVYHQDFETFNPDKKEKFTVVARGFPDLTLLYTVAKKKNIDQLLIISSEVKIRELVKKNAIQNHQICDIKNRDILKIFILECFT
jgi:16S rRNA (guanine(527)-N(7))-methyltransferase RsmG